MSAPLATAAAAAPEASAEEIKDAFATTKAYFRSGATRSLTWRLAQLKVCGRFAVPPRPLPHCCGRLCVCM